MPFKQKLSAVCCNSILLLFLVLGCGKPGINHWSDLVPEAAFYVIVPEENTTLEEMLARPFMPLLDDATPSAIQLASNLHEQSLSPLYIDAMLLYPDSSNDWQPVWISQKTDGLLDHFTSMYQRDFEQNQYEFLGHTIEKLFFTGRVIFIIDLGSWTVFSESSLAIEDILRTIHGSNRAAQISSGQLVPGSFIVNAESLDLWAKQLAQVTYSPFLTDIFKGGNPVSFTFQNGENEAWNWQMHGEMQIGDERSPLVTSITADPAPFLLDRYVPVNAAAFSIFHSSPADFNIDKIEPVQDIDQYLAANPQMLQPIRQNIGTETAFVAFAESGPNSSSEYLFLRQINNPDLIKSVFDDLEERGLAIKDEDTYAVNSVILGKLLGSSLNPGGDLHITIYDRVAAMAQRKGLAEIVGGDAERRRVMFYDDNYSRVLNALSGPFSSIFYMDAARFGNYIQPWLYPQHYAGPLLATMDEFVITTQRQPGQPAVDISLTNFERERTDRPYREQWVFPLGETEITGKPVIANVTGSARDEVVFSTENGSLFVLASDGTTVLQVSTNDDQPIGSPVVYDWYGNNQNVIMQAAGDKIYAWNRNGEMLPNFPVYLNEEITTPLTVMDINGNGMAEMILATGDRSLHVLNARGQALNGWPRSTNSVVRSAPLIAGFGGTRSVLAFAENTLHGWGINGQIRENFPVFLSAQIHGSPAAYHGHLLGAGRDGNLYSIGTSPLFYESLATSHQSGPLIVQSIPVSNSSLNSTPVVHSVLLREGSEFIREDLILLQSGNGSVFLYNSHGELKFAESLGQPGSDVFAPMITDINQDDREDIVALADFGRFYAWDILSGDRHRDLPTTGMRYPIITDFLRTGNQDIIAQTRDGLQCWTIYSTRRESSE